MRAVVVVVTSRTVGVSVRGAVPMAMRVPVAVRAAVAGRVTVRVARRAGVCAN